MHKRSCLDGVTIKRIDKFSIIKAGDSFIVHNTAKKFKEGHTHIRHYKYCLKLIYNVLQKKRPATKNMYLLESHRRISDNETYKELIKQLMESRKNKKQNYVNIQKGVRV